MVCISPRPRPVRQKNDAKKSDQKNAKKTLGKEKEKRQVLDEKSVKEKDLVGGLKRAQKQIQGS
jgi:hypothetical protein